MKTLREAILLWVKEIENGPETGKPLSADQRKIIVTITMRTLKERGFELAGWDKSVGFDVQF